MRILRDVRYNINGRFMRRLSLSFIGPFMLLAVLLFAVAGCGSNTTTGAGSTPTSAPTSGATTLPGKIPNGCPNQAIVTPSQRAPNVTLHMADSNKTNSAHQGDLIEIQLPFGQAWSGPTSSKGVLELQSPYGYAAPTLKMCTWQFVAKGLGTAQLEFSGRAICLKGQLCPQYIISVPFIIEVRGTGIA